MATTQFHVIMGSKAAFTATQLKEHPCPDPFPRTVSSVRPYPVRIATVLSSMRLERREVAEAGRARRRQVSFCHSWAILSKHLTKSLDRIARGLECSSASSYRQRTMILTEVVP